MCGIAGIMRFDQQPMHKNDLQAMLDKIAHRGRDHQGIVAINPHLMLGHRRLSIIDLDESASQPMFLGKHLCVTYNGEIYNYQELKKYLMQRQYQFKTKSDTEVLLAAYDYWGEDCVKYLNGMFAFALWDGKKERLLCARDQLGIKPFYYLLTPTFFAFASESKALAHFCDKRLNMQAVYTYLLSMYVPTDASIYENVYKLSPAHTLTITPRGKQMIQRYWQIAHFETHGAGGHQHHQQLENLSHLLRNAIKRQLQSDVPVGGFLSGGIDSGLITALAAQYCMTYHTYSIGYEGLSADENELPHAKIIANRYGTKHTEVNVNAACAMTYLTQSLQHLSEPIADPAIVGTYMLAECAAQDGVKVLLNGTGGDEIFSGYTRYTGQLSMRRKLFLLLPKWSKTFVNYLPLAHKTKTRMQHLPLDMLFSTGGSYQLAAQIINDQYLLNKCLTNIVDDLQMPAYDSEHQLYQRMLVDVHTYLPDELLFLLDQMTMAHTIEGRVPLLDIDVVTAAFQFKANHHIKDGHTKKILKDIATPYLGNKHVMRKKQGFAGSTYWWVKHNFAVFIDGIANTKTIAGFEHFRIDDYIKYHTLDANRANDIFMLYCFNQWYEHQKI